MGVLSLIKKRFDKQKPLKNIRIGACLHVTAETANLILALKAGGAEVSLCACNPLSTQDDVAASLVRDYGTPVFAKKGEDKKTYYNHLHSVLDFHPHITMDDGADLVSFLHTKRKNLIPEMLGSSEETTTGVIRLRAMERDGILKLPVFAVNESHTKHMFDNRYGTGQSTLDGIMRATNILFAGKKVVVCGYGWCGRGVANRARGLGAQVIVTEVDSIKALEAFMDGFEVLPIAKASRIGDVFITVTGDKEVISFSHIQTMKNGAILANAGHFDVEIAVAELARQATSRRTIREFVDEYTLADGTKRNILSGGRLVNLSAAEGHPAEVMDMSFANQALAAEFFAINRGKLSPKIYTISEEMDREIARMKLEMMGVTIDTLTKEQHKYLTSWKEGT